MTKLVEAIRDAWECLVKPPPDDTNKGLEWLRSQEREAHEATEKIRQRRIRQTDRAYLRDSDFLDNELFGKSRKDPRS